MAAPERFGPYEVTSLLGAGGMGEVYRARDPRLNRSVAIKVLARAGADSARQQRLLDEAQAASALNHPNIITVYDVGAHDGVPFIVSELVEGTSLREILRRAPLGIRETLELAVQMAEGLAAAHQAGIVHRDFKPENVMVTGDGRVKIVDFGLALIGTRDSMLSSSAEQTLTVAGTIAGTVAYMSPEQARGAVVDARSDQFSLGLTLYEMLAGRRAFQGETPAQVLAAIIEDEPEPLAAQNARVPAPLRWIVERCLSKEPRQRYDSTADLARDLRMLRDRLGEFTTTTELPSTPPRRTRRGALVALAIAAAAGAGLLIGFAGGSSPDTALEQYRFTPIATDAGYQASPAWSPDGKTLAYVAVVDGVLQVFTKALGSPTRTPVTHANFDCRDPFWSPDGTRIYYISLAREREGLWSISAAGGEPEIVVEDVYRAALSPDGKTLAFFRSTRKLNPDVASDDKQLYISSPPGAPETRYERGPFKNSRGYVEVTLHFSPDGTRLGTWLERPGEKDGLMSEFWNLPLTGPEPNRVPAPVPDLRGLAPMFTWLPDNRHVITAVPRPLPGVHLWLMDTQGDPARLLTSTVGREDDPAASPDGSRLAFTVQRADYDIYEFSVDRPTPIPVLATSQSEMDPSWSARRNQIAFTTDRSGTGEIWLHSENGEERPVVTNADFGQSRTDLLSAPAFSPDGERIAFNRAGPEGLQVWITSVGGGTPVQLRNDFLVQDSPGWSPDGLWIAYAQADAGVWSLVKARAGSRTPQEMLVKEIVASSPVQWSPTGAWIAFNSPNGLSLVTPDGKTSHLLQEQVWMAFAWSADGRQLFGIRLSDDLQHMTYTSVQVPSGAERVLGKNFMSLPVSGRLVRGMTRTSPSTFLASIVAVRSDVWLLENFIRPRSFRDRLARGLPWFAR
jgi:serine/threonine protein kinase